MTAAERWSAHYATSTSAGGQRPLYPTEWVVRTLAGGRYPQLQLDRSRYAGAYALDMGCGDGRNLGLLLDLGFEVHACEIAPAMVEALRERTGAWPRPVQLAVGRSDALPYPDARFDLMLCSSSCYYLEGAMTWPAVRAELARVLKPGALLVANFPDERNDVLRNAVRQGDGSLLITGDPFGIRNGTRFMAAAEPSALPALLAPEFELIATGHLDDDYYGLRVSGCLSVSRRG